MPHAVRETSGGRRISRRERAWFVAVGVVAVVLRVPAVFVGLPYLSHPDEPVNLAVARRMVAERSLNPRFFDYPSLAYDIQAAAHAAYRLLGRLVGGGASNEVMVSANLGVAKALDPGAVLVARGVTFSISLAIVAIVGWLAWLVSNDRRTVLVAAALAAVSAPLVEHAALVTPDTLTAATATLAVCAALRLRHSGTAAAYLIAGAAVGLAAASKYNAAVVALAVVAAHLMRVDRHHRRLVFAGLSAITAFLVTCPFVVLDHSTFLANLRSVLSHYSTGHDGYEGNSWAMNSWWLAIAFGPILVLAVSPIIREVRRRRSNSWRSLDDTTAIPVAVFVAASFVLVAAQQVRFERNLLPLIPSLVALVAVGVRQLRDRLAVRATFRRRALSGVLAVSVVWFVAVGVSASIEAARDPVDETREWITAYVPAGQVIVVDSYGPFLDADRWTLRHPRYALVETEVTFGATPDVVIVSRRGSGRYLDLADDKGARATLAALVAAACADISLDDDTVRVLVLRCDG